MRARLGSHREALLQFITDWSKIRRLLGRHLPTCFCSLGHELWLGVTRCRFCLGTNKKHSHKGCGLTKEASYFQRNRIAWYPAVLRHIAHGLDAMEARRQVDMERRVREGRDKTAAKLDKLRRQRDEEEKQILFDQRLAEVLSHVRPGFFHLACRILVRYR